MRLSQKFKSHTVSSIGLATILLIPNLPSNALAHDNSSAEPKYSENYLNCMQKSDGITIEMRSCISKEFSIQDKRLNKNYERYFNTAKDNVKKKLRAAQRAWIQFRDKECEFAGSQEEARTLEPILITSCYLDMTARRADEFE